MGIKFPCPECGKVINVKDFLAGKRGFCPKCQARVDIPLQSTAGASANVGREGSVEPVKQVDAPTVLEPTIDVRPTTTANHPAAGEAPPTPAPSEPHSATAAAAGAGVAQPAEIAPVSGPIQGGDIGVGPMQQHASGPAAAPTPGSPAAAPPTVTPGPGGMADPISAAPHLQWYVLPTGSQTPFGPAVGEVMRQWIAEGRVAADTLVWRQDWPQWHRAGSVLPQVNALQPPPAGMRMGVPMAMGMPMGGAGMANAGYGGPVASGMGMPVASGVPVATVGVPVATVGHPSAPASDMLREPVIQRRRRRRWLNLIVLLVLVALIAALSPLVYKAVSGGLSAPRPAKPPETGVRVPPRADRS